MPYGPRYISHEVVAAEKHFCFVIKGPLQRTPNAAPTGEVLPVSPQDKSTVHPRHQAWLGHTCSPGAGLFRAGVSGVDPHGGHHHETTSQEI